MTHTPRSFAAEFPDQDESRWRGLVDAALKGQPFDRLVARTADGVGVGPLFRETDAATSGDESGLPGQAPFIRGAHVARDRYMPWLIRQAFAHPDIAQTNREILADLEGGVAAVDLVIDPDGAAGVAIRDRTGLEQALAGVHLDLAPVSLEAGGAGVASARLLAEVLAASGKQAQAPGFNMDPLAVLMRAGEDPFPLLHEAVALTKDLQARFPGATWLRADARPVHEAGGSEAQELAAALATGIAYLRALTTAGVAVDDAARAITFSLAVGADVLVEAAKLRALRLCWARVLEASHVREDGRGAAICATTSRRMMTRHDAWTNMLRTTAACFAAAVGGADSITVRPMTDALGLPTAFARRMARNTQLVLMEESRLGHVIDPAGGAWFVEKMTLDLAAAAWTLMQQIEAQGGIVAALQSGALQAQVGETRDKRMKAFATRRETITGVTDFPLLRQDPPAVLAPFPAPPKSDSLLSPIRWAEPFEVLRDRGETAKARVFFANLGPLADFSARANFARNLFAVGGIDAIGPEDVFADHAAMARLFTETDARVAVLCGSDARYASDAAAAATHLKSSGCDWLVYAGKPADEAALREAGVDQFVFAGQDALQALTTLHAALGIA